MLSNDNYAYQGRSGEIQLGGQVSGLDLRSDAISLSEFSGEEAMELYFARLDAARDAYLAESVQLEVPEVFVVGASFLTVGYMAWMIRGGVILTTLVSQTSAYQFLDIGALLESATGGNESIESMVDR